MAISTLKHWYARAGHPDLRSLGELALLKSLLQQQRRHGQQQLGSSRLWIPPGDDGAAWRWPQGAGAAASSLIVTTDMLVENIDFRLRWATPADVGHKLIAVNASDLAAMGASPVGIVLSVALPGQLAAKAVRQLQQAVLQACAQYQLLLFGGDISSTDGPIVLSATAFGRCTTRQVLRRFRGRAGDIIAVTGPLGVAAAGLTALEQDLVAPKALVQAQLRPRAQLAFGQWLARQTGVHAGCDISDGLLQDVRYLGKPGTGVLLAADRIPTAPALFALAAKWGKDPWRWLLAGGEDFELALAIAPQRFADLQRKANRLGHKLYAIGQLVDHPSWQLRGLPKAYQLSSLGFAHFTSP